MKIRFYIDPETKQPHIYNHAVNESEVKSVLKKPGEDRPGREGSRVAMVDIFVLYMFLIPFLTVSL
jgi:hypothetical protein